MIDIQILNAQKRNLMILNCIVFLILVSGESIDSFKILDISFNISESNKSFDSFNVFIYIAWIYTLFRYLASYFAYSNTKQEEYNNKTISKYLNEGSYFLAFITFLNKIFKFCLHQDSYDLLLPVAFFIFNLSLFKDGYYDTVRISLLVFVPILTLYVITTTAQQQEVNRFKD